MPPIAPHSAGLVLAVELPLPRITPSRQPYTDWVSWLQPGGVLAVLTASPSGAGRFVNSAGLVIAAATAAGFTYRQHIITVPARPDTNAQAVSDPVQVPAHHDLLLFTADHGGIR
ncbi:hypothetical protein M8C13_05485 [Crossiella sp. SN42]|uniref:hypothetical protein n=1 Tax=Crossiella sp. SN42 TaxID=2944808 RepID=UPI00207C9D24|nr:hypothetical protein [Crossiella sp. SN42]MCO1575211.1 hypothetical protein [Crossiella sp. SN42]